MAGLSVLQVLPALQSGGVERGTLEIAAALVNAGHRALVMSAGGSMVEELQALGAQHFTWPIGNKSVLTLRLIRPLRRFLTEQKVDILHVRSRFPAWIAYLAWRGMAPGRRPHFITTVHGLYSVNAYSRIMTKGETIIAVSATVRDYLLQHYPDIPRERIQVIHRGVSAADYPYGYRPEEAWRTAFFQQYPEAAGKQLLTLPGRVTRLKGHEAFIEILAELVQEGRPVHGLIVGGASASKQRYLVELQQEVRAQGLAPHLTFTGQRQDLKNILAISRLVFSLSIQPESFGRTTLEALRLGIPVAGYNHGGVGEILRSVYPAGCLPLQERNGCLARIRSLLDEAPAVPSDEFFPLSAMLARTLEVYTRLAPPPLTPGPSPRERGEGPGVRGRMLTNSHPFFKTTANNPETRATHMQPKSLQASNPIRVKVMGLLPARYWMHQFPGNLPEWDGCTFSFDPDCREYDWLVVNNELPARAGGRKGSGFEQLACPPRHTMLTTTEPSSIKIYGKAYTDQFGCVLTSQEEWALPHPDRIFSQPALHWFYGVGAHHETSFDQMVSALPVNKTRPISMVYSAKKQWHTLHRKRFKFMQAMIAGLPDLDLYGRGATPLDDKAEALDAYRYHIAIENFIGAHHWTEKLADPFLGLTLPFYCGCPNAADYFPPESFIAIDINNPEAALQCITDAIKNNEYEKRLPHIREARRLVLYEYNFFAVVAREIRKRHDPQRQADGSHTLYSRHMLRNRSPISAVRDLYEKTRARVVHMTMKR